MSARTARDAFVVQMEREGVPLHVSQLLMRKATTLRRLWVDQANGVKPQTADESTMAAVAKLLAPYKITAEQSDLNLRLHVPSGADESMGGVYVPHGARV